MSAYVNEAMAEQTFLSGLLGRLHRRKALIISVTLLLFVLMVVAIEMLPKSYRAVASVAIEGQTPTAGLQAGDVMRDMPFDEQTLGTEVAILQSRELLVDTINKLGLINKPGSILTFASHGSVRLRPICGSRLPAGCPRNRSWKSARPTR